MKNEQQDEIFELLKCVISKTKLPVLGLDTKYVSDFLKAERMDGFFIDSDAEELNLPHSVAMQDMIGQKLLLQTAYAVSEKSKEKNIPVAFFKGPILSNAYPSNICRISGDVDLYIPQEYEKEFEEMMLGLGAEKTGSVTEGQSGEADFMFKGRNKFEAHYIMCTWLYKSQHDILEKYKVFSEDSFVSVETNEGTYTSLDFTDHMFLQIYHFWSHYAYKDHKCMRMLCDITAFVNKYAPRIDFDRLNTILNETGFMKLASAIFTVCEEKLGMKDLGYTSPDVKRLIDGLNWETGKAAEKDDILRANYTWSAFVIETIRKDDGKMEIRQSKNRRNYFNKYSRTWLSNCRYWKIYKGQKMNG